MDSDPAPILPPPDSWKFWKDESLALRRRPRLLVDPQRHRDGRRNEGTSRRKTTSSDVRVSGSPEGGDTCDHPPRGGWHSLSLRTKTYRVYVPTVASDWDWFVEGFLVRVNWFPSG